MGTMCIPKIPAKPNKRAIKHMQGELFVHGHLRPTLEPDIEWRHQSLPCHNAGTYACICLHTYMGTVQRELYTV